MDKCLKYIKVLTVELDESMLIIPSYMQIDKWLKQLLNTWLKKVMDKCLKCTVKSTDKYFSHGAELCLTKKGGEMIYVIIDLQ